MTSFGEKIDSLTRYRRGWDALTRAAMGSHSPPRDSLAELDRPENNPGQLRMLGHVPADLPRGAPLVVCLHGCQQTAAAYEGSAGWSDLAEQAGFALLCPEQTRGNNPQGCFNWFQPGDITRGGGEVESIRQMIEQMLATHALDRRRVFITGLSAGGAMTAAMLATYPEIFAGGAIIAGLPYGGAGNVQEALETMMRGRPRPAEEWAALARNASNWHGPWPRVSIWQGEADTTVVPANAGELVKQFAALHGVEGPPALVEQLDGARHSVWRDARGQACVEAFLVPGLAHGTPINTTAADPLERCGEAGPFVLEAGIASTLHIARFWGILPATRKPRVTPVLEKVGRGLQDPRGVIERALKAAGILK